MTSVGRLEYRIRGKDKRGKEIQRITTAASYFDARRKAKQYLGFDSKHPIRIARKRVFAYQAYQGSRLIDGSESAFTRSEVVKTLERLGFRVRSVRRRREGGSRAPSNEIASFVGQCAKLTEQKLPFNDVLHLLAANVKDGNIRSALREINNDLRNGTDSADAFMNQAKVFGTHTSLLLGLATKSGDMKSIFESVAQLVERQAQFKKSLTSSLILPAVTAMTLVAAIGFYAVSLLPRIVNTLRPVMEEVPPLTETTLAASELINQHIVEFLILSVGMIVGGFVYRATKTGRLTTDKLLLNIPYVGSIIRNTCIEIFCRVLGIMYTSGENIDAIQIAADATGNMHFARQIRTVAVPSMLKYGTELGKALESTNLFPDMIISRFRTAADTGNVKGTATQLADYYQMENGYALKNLVNIVELSVTFIIMIALVFLTYLSSETASIRIDRMR